jgi:hypothetical protein
LRTHTILTFSYNVNRTRAIDMIDGCATFLLIPTHLHVLPVLGDSTHWSANMPLCCCCLASTIFLLLTLGLSSQLMCACRSSHAFCSKASFVPCSLETANLSLAAVLDLLARLSSILPLPVILIAVSLS